MTRLFLISLLLAVHVPARAEEGMYPVTRMGGLDLRARGILLEPAEIYTPGRASLSDAMVQVGGCSGSFVSDEGLILTNHHCAFGGVQAISSPEQDYITHGFLARTRAEEAPFRNVAARITESHRDVTDELLKGIPESADPEARAELLEGNKRRILSAAETEFPGRTLEVSEMFPGRSYILFVYAMIRDLRLVYVPPRSIGQFGGEIDNYSWPRHTGDFAFLRAYVAPDGSPAVYASENIPYRPPRILRIAPQGVAEGDPVFMLGYPGRTYRHQPADFVAHQETIRLPVLVSWYEEQLSVMRAISQQDRRAGIALAARVEQVANLLKRYTGQLRGMKRLGLVDRKRGEEQRLQEFVEADSKRTAAYGQVLTGIGRVYADLQTIAERDFVLEQLAGSSVLLTIARSIVDLAEEREKPDAERTAPYRDRNIAQTALQTVARLRQFHGQADRSLLTSMLLRAVRLPEGQRLSTLEDEIGGTSRKAVDRFVERLFARSKLSDSLYVASFFDPPPSPRLDDPFLQFAQRLKPADREWRKERTARDNALNKLLALYGDVRRQYLKTEFIPDANRTLRMTLGRVEGYAPADALYALPITTVGGLVEKTTGVEPFDAPPGLLRLHTRRVFGRLKHPVLNDVPVALLSSLDTVGGNSGSALLNARGEVVGLNFDRVWEATINDYAWSPSYSRSIAVDVRFILWVTGFFAKADHLIRELGVESVYGGMGKD